VAKDGNEVARFADLDRHAVRALADHYGLSLVGFKPIEGGSGNSSYQLQSQQGDYVLTVFDDKSREYVDRLGQLLLVLEEHGFPTTRLLQPEQGCMTAMYGDKPVMLKEYIVGDVCRDLSLAMLSQVGASMATLHQLEIPDQLVEREHPYGLHLFRSVIGRNIDPSYESWLAGQIPYLTEKIPADVPRGFIHGDLFYDNLLFEGDELRAIIDFEEACLYFKAFDLGMGIVGTCIDDTKVVPEKVAALVAGYQGVRLLEEEERRTLPLFAEYAATATSCWRYWKYNFHNPLAEDAKQHWQMVRLAEEFREMDPP
jgi:homoserine kinase type II